jgi:hypothetical protein
MEYMIKLLNDLSMFTKPNMLKDMKMNLRKDTMQLREKVNRLRPMRPDVSLEEAFVTATMASNLSFSDILRLVNNPWIEISQVINQQ